MNDSRHMGRGAPLPSGATVIDLAAARRARTTPQMPWAMCGSASYHEAAIKKEKDDARHAV